VKSLDLVFYQSHELLEVALAALESPIERMSNRHVVLPHGIPEPPVSTQRETRSRIRKRFGLTDDRTVLLYTGRIIRNKGVYELLTAVVSAVKQNPEIVCLMVGSHPAYDETDRVQKTIAASELLLRHVKLLPAFEPDEIWDYLAAADIFVFHSHREGMPNSLLEAMAVGLPAVAFAIPAVSEINARSQAVLSVPPLDAARLSEAVIELVRSPSDRVRLGERAMSRVRERYMVRENMAVALDHLAHVIAERKVSSATTGLVANAS
jgi:glycosyltransferase involved in cell wall biosynthesis